MADSVLPFSVASVVENVLQQHGNRHGGDLDLVESRRAEQAAFRRYEAASWLRKMVGVVGARDLPAEPSEEEFRLGLRSGIILCSVFNKIQPGAVSKVVESPCNAALIPDGAALSAFQYFENVRNFLVAAQELGLPTFEASDLEQGGTSARVVNCVLALKSYSDWKQSGGAGVWKFGGNVKPPTTSGNSFVRKNSEPFMNSLSRNSSMNEKLLNNHSSAIDSTNMTSCSSSFSTLVRTILSNRKPEEVPSLVESVLNKVVEEFEHRISSEKDLMKTSSKEFISSNGNKFLPRPAFGDRQADEKIFKIKHKNKSLEGKLIIDEDLLMKQHTIFDQQQKDIQGLRQNLHTTKAGMQFMRTKFLEEFHNLGMHIHGLAHAASGYHKVLEENRKLYNLVQDLKGSIRVYCRVRPFLSGKSNYMSSVDHIEDGTVTINTSLKNGKGHRSFNFNKVFGPSATQAEVFADMQPLIRSVLDGYNVCIFAYGQTGSGKTHTMTGPKELTERSVGVNYRALGDLFALAEQRRNIFHYDVAVQMIEIYNEQVRDLLVTDGSNKRLEIRNSSQTGLNVPNASLIPVSSTADVIDLMNLGQRNRAVGATALNDRSSRSHSCLTVHIQGRDLTSGNILRGCMHLVDLAGSERVDKSEATGDRLKEAQHINKSLSALGDVIASLALKNPHVPYRNSKLTQLLQDSLGGQAKTLMFVHISPEPEAVGETISTLKFAERVSTVELGAARVNKDTADVKELKEQVANLKAALARKKGESDHIPHPISGSSETHRTKIGESSPMHPVQHRKDTLGDCNGFRRPMGDVGNIEVLNSSTLRQKKQSYDDLDELLANSPPWPSVSNVGQNFGDEDKESSSGEWVDKVMVNKLDAVSRLENPSGYWDMDNVHQSNVFYQKYSSDSSAVYSEQSYNIFPGANQYNTSNVEEMDDVDVATSDSSEPDLFWQFNHSKLPITNELASKTKTPKPKTAKSPLMSKSNTATIVPSPSRKQANGFQRNGRQPVPADAKRKNVNRK